MIRRRIGIRTRLAQPSALHWVAPTATLHAIAPAQESSASYMGGSRSDVVSLALLDSFPIAPFLAIGIAQ